MAECPVVWPHKGSWHTDSSSPSNVPYWQTFGKSTATCDRITLTGVETTVKHGAGQSQLHQLTESHNAVISHEK